MKSLIRHLRDIATLLAVLALAGCAFGTREPTLIYPPAPDAEAVAPAQAAAKPAPKNVQIVLTPFSDNRSDKKVVGTMRNGFGMRTADVIPTNSVPEWVMNAVKTELQNVGYTVLTGAANRNSAREKTAVVSGEILNVFCDMYFSYTGQVSLIARVSKNDKEVLSKHYAGEGSAGIAFAGTAESFAQSLALALASAVRQFVAELDKVLVAP